MQWWVLQLAGHRLRRGLCLQLAPVALTDCVVNQARWLFMATNQQRLTPFMRGVHNTELLNGWIIGQISCTSVQKRIKDRCTSDANYIIQYGNLYIFVSKNVKIGYRSFHPSGVFSVAPVVDNKQAISVTHSGGGGCLMLYSLCWHLLFGWGPKSQTDI